MDILSLADIKNHLNIDNNLDDAYLKELMAAAKDAIELNINRELTDSECLDSDGNVRPAIKHAMRLLVGTWYASRESIAFTSVNEVPYSVACLLTPLKKYC